MDVDSISPGFCPDRAGSLAPTAPVFLYHSVTRFHAHQRPRQCRKLSKWYFVCSSGAATGGWYCGGGFCAQGRLIMAWQHLKKTREQVSHRQLFVPQCAPQENKLPTNSYSFHSMRLTTAFARRWRDLVVVECNRITLLPDFPLEC